MRWPPLIWPCVAGVWLCAYFDGAAGEGSSAPVELLTPEKALETVRFMVDADTASTGNPHGAVSLSPDQRTWVTRLVRGDVGRNGVWMELVAGRRESLEAAARTRTVATLFSSGLGAGGGRAGANQDTSAWASPLRWLDNESLAFLWSDAQGRRQVMRVNVLTSRVEALTAHATGVLNFDVADDGTLLYSAVAEDEPSRLEQQLREGFVIEPRTDAASVMKGRVNEGSYIDRLWRTQWFVKRGAATAASVDIAQRKFSPNQLERAWLSAQGRWALVNGAAPSLPTQWDLYVESRMVKRLKNARINAHSLLGRLVHQAWVLDTQTGVSHALWSVPADPGALQCAWSPEADAVILAPTFLPADDPDERGRQGTAAAVVERASGRYRVLPIDLRGQVVTRVQWPASNRVQMDVGPRGNPQRIEFSRVAGQWRRVESGASAATGVRLEIREGLDTPPVLMAVENESQRSVTVIDPNPLLVKRFDLGHAERLEGPVEEGVRWEGLLFHPPNYNRERRYPLVIQSVYGMAILDEFTLYGFLHGYGLGPTLIPPYPGRLLAQHDMLVLQLNVAGETGSGTPREAAIRTRAFEQAARQLTDAGRVDGARVGLIGFSRNGFYVEYALTHSEFPYAAAIAADHWQPDYVGQTLMGYDMGAEEVNGGLPFGAGLAQWLSASPGFNADRVRTPLLQIEQTSGLVGVLLHWELFSRLRYLKKPVEFWVIPNASLGVHNTQNPEQLVAIQSRVIDWFRFWLDGQESAAPDKREQFRRWRVFRDHELHDERTSPGANASGIAGFNLRPTAEPTVQYPGA